MTKQPVRTAGVAVRVPPFFGAEHVAILDGRLQKWTRESRPLESGPATPRKARFAALARMMW